jgi:hypothetical protein
MKKLSSGTKVFDVFSSMKSLLKIASFVLQIAVLAHFSCKKEYSCESCSEKNKPPIAVAGPDQVITLPTDSVSLKGINSSDPDGTISGWLWRKISGPASFNIINPSDSTTKVKALVIGIYQIELKVTDNGGLSAKDTMKITVDSVLRINHKPIANAGTDQTITLPTNTINLDGSASTDPDNNITGYIWTKISGPSSFNITNTNSIQTRVTDLVQGIYQFQLKVIDAGGLFSKDTAEVSVNPEPPSLSPFANAGPDMIITLPLDSAFIDGSHSPSINVQWTKIAGPSQGILINSTASMLLAKNLVPGTYSFRLQTGRGGLMAADTMNLQVVDDPQEHNTITYKNIEWFVSDIYGLGLQSISLLKPDWNFDVNYPVDVYLQMDPNSQWFILPASLAGIMYSFDCIPGNCLYRLWIMPNPEDWSWVGRKSSIKVKIL